MGSIDTHLHLSGCLSPMFVWDVIKSRKLTFLADSIEDVIKQMTFSENEPRDFYRFLGKFKILDELPWDEKIIELAIEDASQYLINNHIDYAWIDFSINKYMKIGWHKHEVIKYIKSLFDKYAPNRVGLVLAIKYESAQAGQRQYAKLIEHEEMVSSLVGIDIVGDEAYFDSDFYAQILDSWIKQGKMVRTHVGESQPSVNVYESISKINVTNIAHGINVLDHKYATELAKDKGITFDLSLTSNYVTAVWKNTEHHPIIDMVRNGLLVTIGSDDPIQFNTTLHNEYELAAKLGLTANELDKIIRTAANNVKRFSVC